MSHPRFIMDQSRIAGSLAQLLLDQRHVPEAINYARRAVNCLENVSSADVNSRVLMAQAVRLLGDAFTLLADWDKAIAYYREAELIWAELSLMDDEDLRCRIEVMVGLGTAFLIGKRRPELALEPLKTAIELLKKIKKPGTWATGSLAGALDRLGSAQADAGRHDEALACYLEAQAILRRLPANTPQKTADLAVNLLNVAIGFSKPVF
jgi:tetratricopeptide (TPR) repeat protein